tara:strand:+ start:111 stop:608 length:498 start_codon:yes stop_codon:yes gene_type:complete
MWTIIKIDKKYLGLLKRELDKKLGAGLDIYNPKLCVEKYYKNKLIRKELTLLGDYIFCFHNQFSNPNILNSLRFTKGLKYFLNGFDQSQIEIKNFISKCKESENNDGYLTQKFYQMCLNNNYKFTSGPFTDQIFKIINLQKNKIDILIGSIKTNIGKDKFLFRPV